MRCSLPRRLPTGSPSWPTGPSPISVRHSIFSGNRPIRASDNFYKPFSTEAGGRRVPILRHPSAGVRPLSDQEPDARDCRATAGHMGRRDLIRLGGAGTAAALLVESMDAKSAAAAAPPAVDETFKDFTLLNINSDDDSLAKAQTNGLIAATSNDWPYSYLDAASGA